MFIGFIKRFGEKDKMRGLQSILSNFCKGFNKFNNTGIPMLDSDYHMTFKLLKNRFLACKSENLATFMQLVVYQFY